MTTQVYLLVLTAALLHAGWNAVVKSSSDGLIRLTLLHVVVGVAALFFLPFIGFPAGPSWPYLIASVFIHCGYYLFLVQSYRFGDLSQVYPVARGSAPLPVAIGSFVLESESIHPLGLFGVFLVSTGILTLCSAGQLNRAIFFAFCTGLSIAAYTLVDGIGGRLSEDVYAYIVYLFLLEPIPILIFTWQRRKGQILATFRMDWASILAGGLMTATAYGIVIWAMSTTPMAYVSALRETSVIFATLLGLIVFREPLGRRRIIASVIVVIGAILLQWNADS